MTSPTNPNQEPLRSPGASRSPSPTGPSVDRAQIPPSSQAPPIPINALRAVQSREEFFQSLDTWTNDPIITAEEKNSRMKAKTRISNYCEREQTTLDLSGLRLTSIPNLNFLRALKDINLAGNQLTSIDLQGLPELITLDLSYNQFTSFNGQGLSALQCLSLEGNQLTSIDLQGLPELITLDLSYNQFTSFNGQGLSALQCLSLAGNQLTSIDLQDLPGLIQLTLNNNQLTSFNGQGLTALIQLTLNNNQLTSFNGQGLTALTQLTLNNNQLTSFNGQGLTALIQLTLNNNQLTSFNGQGLTALTQLTLNNNQLTSFNGQGLTALIQLILNNNQLTSFNGQGLTALTQLTLNNNQLTSFNGQGLTALIQLTLNNNHLTSFADITLPTPNSLEFLWLNNNPFTRVNSASRIITMRIPSEVIQDIPEDDLPQYGVEIMPNPRDAITTSLPDILTKLNTTATPNLLAHPNAPNLAKFLERMMLSWPCYDNFFRSFVELAENNPDFREELFEGVVSTETNCHDRPLYFFSRLSVTAAAYAAEKANDPKALVQNLIALKYLDLIDAKAREVCQGEALEVALYLQLQLRSRLNLPIAIDSMAFNEYAHIAISTYLQNHPEEPQTVSEWVDRVATHALSMSATEEQQQEILCDTPYFCKRCEKDPQIERMKILYTAASSLILDTTTDNEITTLEEILAPSEIESLENTSLNDILSLAKRSLPKELQNVPFQDLTDQQKNDCLKTLGNMKDKALQDLTFQLMKSQAKDLIEQAKKS